MGFYLSPSLQGAVFFGAQQESFIPEHYKGFLSNELIYQQPFVSVAQTLNLQQLVFAHQTHGILGTRVTEKAVPVFMQDSDFLITTERSVGIAVATADCIPLVIYSTEYPVIAIVHAGWRGTVAGIVTVALQQFLPLAQYRTETVSIIIGPCARVCCYQVSEDFLKGLDPQFHRFVQERDGILFFDGVACNRFLITTLGISETAIQDTALCTMHDAGYCSHRSSRGLPERQYTVASLK